MRAARGRWSRHWWHWRPRRGWLTFEPAAALPERLDEILFDAALLALDVHRVHKELGAVRGELEQRRLAHLQVGELLPAVGHDEEGATGLTPAAAEVQHEPLAPHDLHDLGQPRCVEPPLAEDVRRHDHMRGAGLKV